MYPSTLKNQTFVAKEPSKLEAAMKRLSFDAKQLVENKPVDGGPNRHDGEWLSPNISPLVGPDDDFESLLTGITSHPNLSKPLTHTYSSIHDSKCIKEQRAELWKLFVHEKKAIAAENDDEETSASLVTNAGFNCECGHMNNSLMGTIAETKSGMWIGWTLEFRSPIKSTSGGEESGDDTEVFDPEYDDCNVLNSKETTPEEHRDQEHEEEEQVEEESEEETTDSPPVYDEDSIWQ